MPYGLYLSAEGAQVQNRRMEVIANNLANVDTVGFKRDLAIFQARYAQAIEQGSASAGAGTLNDLGGGVQFQETKTDFTSGPLRKTGAASDVALHGDAFFVVRNGQDTYLTRAGNFSMSAAGELVTQQGYRVMGEGNTPIAINTTGGPWHITDDGAVYQDGNRQSLAIVKPASMSDLVKSGDSLFRPLAEAQPVPAAERSVVPGFLEMSGVQPTTEMTALIETSRMLEANVNMMKTQDQLLSGLINRILKP